MEPERVGDDTVGDEGLSVRKMDLELSLIGESQFITCCTASSDKLCV